LRCFVALEIPEETREVVLAWGRAVQASEPTWTGEKWVAAELMHVTLKFLGDLDPARIERFAADFRASAGTIEPFTLHVARLLAVPRLTRATMLWASMEDPTGRCHDLAAAAETSSRHASVRRDARTFAPHVTLVRARKPLAVASATLAGAVSTSATAGVQTMSVLSATLYASTLTPSGPVHVRIEQFRLRTR
jgi:2'-5' RNA ligase